MYKGGVFLSLLLMIRSVLWGPVTICAIIGTGICYTVRGRAFQCRAGTVLRGTLLQKDTKSCGGISPLRTLTAALGACMGTGNIAGVGAALLTGGPGALVWMCVSAFFGMMTSFAETVLAVRYRKHTENGSPVGGAMFVLQKGLGLRKTGMAYAALLTLSSFGVGNMAQVSAAASAIHTAFGVPTVAVSTVFAVCVLLTVCGGIRRIAAVTEKAVPLLSAVFMLSAGAAIVLHADKVPAVLQSVSRSAFCVRAVGGGVVGQAIRVGVTRGVFSNEAGLGSTAVIHAASDCDDPAQQGLWGILEVFLDTVLMCTVTGLVILTSGIPVGGTDGASLYAEALAETFGKGGEVLTAVTLALLGFASLVGWSYCGERGTAYLLGEKGLPAFRVLYAAAAFGAGFLPLDTVFLLSDIANALTAIPNLLTLWLLSGTVFAELRRYKMVQSGIYFPRKHSRKKEETV